MVAHFCSKCKCPAERPGYCRECFRVYFKDWRVKHRKKYNDYLRQTGKRRRASNLERRREAHRKKTYGLSSKDFERLVRMQNNRCSICGFAFKTDRGRNDIPWVDHDHATLQVRGLLCGGCNRGLGQFKDSIRCLESAIIYLRKAGLT